MSMTRSLFIARKGEERWIRAGEREGKGRSWREGGNEVQSWRVMGGGHSWRERGGRVKVSERERGRRVELGREKRGGFKAGEGEREKGKEFQSWGEGERGIIDGRERGVLASAREGRGVKAGESEGRSFIAGERGKGVHRWERGGVIARAREGRGG